MQNITIPDYILSTVKGLRLENPSDQRALALTLPHPEEFTKSTLSWFESLIARGGKRFEAPMP